MPCGHYGCPVGATPGRGCDAPPNDSLAGAGGVPAGKIVIEARGGVAAGVAAAVVEEGGTLGDLAVSPGVPHPQRTVPPVPAAAAAAAFAVTNPVPCLGPAPPIAHPWPQQGGGWPGGVPVEARVGGAGDVGGPGEGTRGSSGTVRAGGGAALTAGAGEALWGKWVAVRVGGTLRWGGGGAAGGGDPAPYPPRVTS